MLDEDDSFEQMQRGAIRANLVGIVTGTIAAAATAWLSWMAISGRVGFLPALLIVGLITVAIGAVVMQISALITYLISRGS